MYMARLGEGVGSRSRAGPAFDFVQHVTQVLCEFGWPGSGAQEWTLHDVACVEAGRVRS